MSGGVPCCCSGFKNTTRQAAKQAYMWKNWRVMHRRCNYSAFNGYHYTPSDYSCITCLVCRGSWRTKAGYVGLLNDATDKELGINRGKEEKEESC